MIRTIKAGQKLWLSKYALSDGVKEVAAKYDEAEGERYVSVAGYWNSYLLGRDIFLNEAAAIAAAEQQRIKKIASLKKQIAKLEALSFDLKVGA